MARGVASQNKLRGLNRLQLLKVGTIKILVFPDFSSNLTQFAQVVGALTQGELEKQMKLMAVCREDCTCGGKRDIESKTIRLVFDRRGAWVRV